MMLVSLDAASKSVTTARQYTPHIIIIIIDSTLCTNSWNI